MTHTTTVRLAQLLPGESINARVTDRDGEITALKASIAAHGIIQSLAVRRQGDSFQVIDGNRRFAALTALHKDGKLPDDAAIPVTIREDDDAAAREASLAANIVRLPLHPADQFEAFAKMRTDGRTIEQIGNAFNLPAKQVKQRLALGTVIPEVMEAFRKNEIDLDAVKAFTPASTERQKEVWDKLSGAKRKPMSWQIKETIQEAAVSGKSALAQFVGTDAYKKAGGTTSSDLFENATLWNDAGLAMTLATEKMQGEIDRLLADGWKWAALEQDLGENIYSWRRLYADERYATPEDERRAKEIEQRQEEIDNINSDDLSPEQNATLTEEYQALETEADEIHGRKIEEFTVEQKSMSGVVIRFDEDHMFTYGVIKPEDAKAAARAERAAQGEPEEDNAGRYNDALTNDLNGVLSDAAQIALANNPGLAEAVLIATLLRSFTKVNPQRWLSISTIGSHYSSHTAFFKQFSKLTGEAAIPADFEEGVAHIAALPAKQRAKLLAHVTAAALTRTTATSLIIKMADPHVEKIWQADEAFLTRLNKAQIVEALEEAECDEAARKASGAKKGDLVQIAAKALGKTKWLPLALRAPTYAGPGPILPTETQKPAHDIGSTFESVEAEPDELEEMDETEDLSETDA